MDQIEKYEPPKLSLLTFVLKVAAGLGAGIMANLILLLLFLLTSSILQPVLNPSGLTTEINPIFIFTLIAIIFLTSLAGNIIGPLLFTLIQREKYKRSSTSLTHVFTLNILILILLIPLYIVSIYIESSSLSASIAGLHLIMATTASLIIFEVISNQRYSLIGIYSTLFAIIIGMAINLLVFELTLGNWTILMFAAMPILWICIGLISAIIESIYHSIYMATDKDFLLTATEYGSDYGVQEKEPEVEEVQRLKTKDEAGTDFLRHQG